MKRQVQPSLWACLATSFAIVLDVDVQVLFAEMGHDGGEVMNPALEEPYCRRAHHLQELIDCCDRRGLAVTAYDLVPVALATPTSEPFVIWEMPFCLDRLRRIIRGQQGVFHGLNPGGNPHAWAWSGEVVIEPAHGRAADLTQYSPQYFYAIRAVQP